MPHLSPMQWLSMIMITWLMLMIMMSINWWSQMPQFYITSSQSKQFKKEINKWSWL